MLDKTFSVTFESDLKNVKTIVKQLLSFIESSITVSKEELNDLKLIFNELLINAVIHGNSGNTEKSVFLSVQIRLQGIIYAIIKDEGQGFNYMNYLKVLSSKNNTIDENGRGILLACSLTDCIQFNEKGNQIMFCKRIYKDE